MTDALTPAVAVAYLRELSTDVRAVLVLDADLEPVAGDPTLGAPGRALLARAGEGGEARGEGGEARGEAAGSRLFAARDERHAVVVACGRLALDGLVRHDLQAVLARLAGGGSPAAGPIEAGGPGG
jgi:hypothetical protein